MLSILIQFIRLMPGHAVKLSGTPSFVSAKKGRKERKEEECITFA